MQTVLHPVHQYMQTTYYDVRIDFFDKFALANFFFQSSASLRLIGMSDGWSSYKCLKDNGFNHLLVNHQQLYKDPFTGAHTITNSTEGLWMHGKRVINGNSYVLALIEYIYVEKKVPRYSVTLI